MNLNKFKSVNLILFACLLTLYIGLSKNYAREKPNIILIVSDDVGFEEIGCYGVLNRDSITPNIDSLAKNGVRFNSCYAQAICGPSRAM